jgi:hypothetical protein
MGEGKLGTARMTAFSLIRSGRLTDCLNKTRQKHSKIVN